MIETVENSLSIGDWASIIGLVVTIVGFIFTIIKVTNSKNAATHAEEAVHSVRQDLRLYQTVHGFSSSVTTMEEIKRLHRSEEWHLLPDRYSNLRKSLITIRCENPVLSDDDQKGIQAAITQFSSLETLIEKHILNIETSNINIPKINSQVSKQIDRIQEILAKLNSGLGGKS